MMTSSNRKSEWITLWREYPNPTASIFETSIEIREGLRASYYHVEGGFKINRHQKNAKLYTNEFEIRDKLSRQLLSGARKDTRLIKAAIEDNMR